MTARPVNDKMIGVLVLAQFAGAAEAGQFVEAACCGKLSVLTDVEFIGRPPGWLHQESIPFRSTRWASWPWARVPSLHLFAFPSSLPLDSSLSNLRFPVRVVGFVLIVNLHSAFSVRALHQGMVERLETTIPFEEAMREAGPLGWVRKHGLPFVVAATDATPPAISLDELRVLCDLGPRVPIVPCYAGFGRRSVKRVLLALADRIKAEGLA